MLLTKPHSSQREDAIAQIKALIDAGAYAPGDRLPPERQLMDRLGLTRTTLRRALEILERDGTIWRHVGKGTFVANPAGSIGAGGLADMCRQLTPLRMMQARQCIEPAIAREAAIHASGEAIIRLNLARGRAVAASTWADYETHDDLFHRSVAEAADNVLLMALFDQLNQVRRAVAWGSVERKTERPPENHSSFAEHEAITAAIEARNPSLAQEAMRQHLGSVSRRLFDEI